jgi:hypothetical protein
VRQFVLHPVGGVSNRLRAILSYRSVHGHLSVVWDADEYVSHAEWADVFEPIPGVTFVTGRKWDREDYAPTAGALKGWEAAYVDLHPVESIRRHIASVQNSLSGHYLAAHIRRTDHVPDVLARGEKVKPLEDYVAWANQWPDRSLYIATDNGVTQRKMSELRRRSYFAEALPADSEEVRATHARYGTLAAAVTDMFVCAGARGFMGTEASSFTDTIQILRGLRTLYGGKAGVM